MIKGLDPNTKLLLLAAVVGALGIIILGYPAELVKAVMVTGLLGTMAGVVAYVFRVQIWKYICLGYRWAYRRLFFRHKTTGGMNHVEAAEPSNDSWAGGGGSSVSELPADGTDG